MKKLLIIYTQLIILVISLTLTSCNDNEEEFLVPSINPTQTEFNVDYSAGTVNVEFDSNVIFYATVDEENKSWLKYQFQDTCQSLVLNYMENDTSIERVGYVTLSKSGVEEILTIKQAGNPNINVGGLQKVNLGYTIDNSSGYTILMTSADEVAKIPIGATIVLECPGDDGTVSFLNPTTYAEYAGGSPVNGEFKFVFTQEIANVTNGSGMMGILRDGFDVTEMYALYEKSDMEFVVDNSSGYTILMISAEFSDEIPLGATVIVECPSNTGTISFLNPATYAEYAGGAPVNGKFSFKWTPEIAGITAGAGMMGILRDGFDVGSLYTVHVQTELEYTIDSSSGYTILAVSAEDAAKIPLGATVVLESASDVGTVSFLNPVDYSEYAGGASSNGIFSFVWTKEIIEVTRTSGIMAILRDGFNVSAMYCHN